MRDLLDGVAPILRGLTMQRGIDLVISVAEDLGTIIADPVKIKQIVYNLASNAVKFSSDASSIRIEARRVDPADSPVYGPAAAIAVIDQGVGIAPEHQQVIFDEFRQIHQPSEKRPSGTGLGLALVRRLVELHHGAVTVESDVGQGATFTVFLPLTPAPSTASLEASVAAG